MGDQGEQFADLAHRLVQALDAWATCVGEPTAKGKPTRKALVAALEKERETPVWQSRKKIDEALLSYWLRGRNQLLPGTKHNRLPSEEDCEAIARALKEKKAPESAQQLPRIGREIADLARSLQDTAGPGWRNRVLASITVQTAEPAEPVESVEPAEPVEVVEQTAGRRQPSLPAPADPAASLESTDLPPIPADDLSAQAPAAGSTTPSEDTEQPAADPPTPQATAGPPAPTASNSWKRPTAIAVGAGLLIALAVAAKGWSGPTGQGGQAEPSSSPATSAAGATTRSSDALGGDSRCSPPKTGPAGVQLRACAKVQRDKVVFALKVDNPTASAVEVTVKVAGFWAGAAHDCKPGPATAHITVEPGTTFTTDPAHCETARQDAPLAYQGEAYIAAGDGQAWVGHAWSPRANVYADRGTLWRCGGDVPC